MMLAVGGWLIRVNPCHFLPHVFCLWVGLVLIQPQDCEACSGRKYLNGSSGVVSDGSEDYPASAHCEWLIDGMLNDV